jgi:hypothetical protein
MYRKSQKLMIEEQKYISLNNNINRFHVLTAGKGRFFKYSLKSIQESYQPDNQQVQDSEENLEE